MSWRRSVLCAAALALLSGGALAQTPGSFSAGQVLAASSLNTSLAAKLDYAGSLNSMSGTPKGALTGACPATGQQGECGSTTLASASAVSISANTAANVITQSFAAGNWLVWGVTCYNASSGSSVASPAQWVSTVSATVPTAPAAAFSFMGPLSLGTATNTCFPTGQVILNLTTTTSVYLGGFVSTGTGTIKAYGVLSWVRIS